MGVFCTRFGKICYKSRNFVHEEMLDDATSVMLLSNDLFFSGSKDSLDHHADKSTCFLPSLRLRRFAPLVSPIVCCFQGDASISSVQFHVPQNLPLKGAGHITKTRTG